MERQSIKQQISNMKVNVGDRRKLVFCKKTLCDASIEAIMEIIAKAIDDEPELPGDMPDEMWEAIRNDRDATEEAIRTTVSLTKEGIKERLGI